MYYHFSTITLIVSLLKQPSPFFTEQLTAFEVWLDHGSEDKKPPEQLPIVLQVRQFLRPIILEPTNAFVIWDEMVTNSPNSLVARDGVWMIQSPFLVYLYHIGSIYIVVYAIFISSWPHVTSVILGVCYTSGQLSTIFHFLFSFALDTIMFYVGPA